MNIVIILTCFALVLILSRLRLPLSACLLIGALVLGLWSGLPPAGLFQAVFLSIRQWATLYFVLIVSLIVLTGNLMKESGHLQRIVYAFVLAVKDRRAVSALVPALIGVLPVPGGALFSAPLVENVIGEGEIPAERKAMINHWFRHLWEYWWPLYPGFVLAVELLGVAAWKVMLFQFPLAVFCLVSGAIFLLRPLGGMGKRGGPPLRGEGIGTLIWEIMPIILVVAVIVLFNLTVRLFFPAGSGPAWPPGMPVLFGLVACVSWIIAVNRLSAQEVREGLLNRRYLDFGLLVVAVMIFKGVLDRSGVIGGINGELTAYHIPVLLIIVILPFISGLVTGICIGFVGASFPVILPLISGLPTVHYLAYAALAYSFGYMGMLFSPVHLCFLVSKDYFQATIPASYKVLLKPVLGVMVLTALYVALLLRLG